MTEMFGEAWSPMSVPDLAPDDDDDDDLDQCSVDPRLLRLHLKTVQERLVCEKKIK